MNDKKLLMDDEYIEFDFNDLDSKQLANKLTASSINETDKQLMNNLEDNFVQKCNLNQDEQEGDDEQTDDDLHQHQNGHSQTNQTSTLNSTTPTTQRRQRRKSANRSKINKILQSSLSSSTNMTNKLTNDNHLNTNVTKDQPQSSSSTTSLSSWIHLPNQQQEQQNHHFNHQLLTKEMMTKNLNSSYDTISEEELIRAKIKKRNQRSIDDDIVSSNVSSADDLPIDSFDDTNKQTETKLSNSDKKQINKQSCDSLSSSPTNISYDSSPTKSISNLSITNNHTNKSMISTTNDTGIGKNQINHQKNLNSVNQMNQNKENQHLNRFNNTMDNGKQMHKHYNLNSINNKTNDHLITTTSSSIPSNVSTNQQQNQCINCHDHHCLNNNYLTFEQQNIPWLYDSISREDADKYLKRFLNVDGVFLVRTSSKIPDNFVLSFVHQQRVKHCHVRRLDVESTICYSIDDGKTKFFDIKSLIEFYQLNGYFLPTKLRFYLVRTN